MKKLFAGMWVLLLGLTLTGCGKPITADDLKAHDWTMETQESDAETKFIASFTDDEMILAFDLSAIESSASNEWEKAGDDLGKQLAESMTFHVAYQLDEETIHLKNEELELDNDYTVRKDEDNIVFTPDEPQETETITLIPKTDTTASSD